MSETAETHSTVARFRVAEGQLVIGDVRVLQLADRVGSTPFFAYDRQLITDRVEEVRAALPEAVRLSYAVKANPMPAVVHHLAGLVDHLDVASGGELQVALDTGLAPEAVSFAGPGKIDTELTQAIAAGSIIEVESASESHRVVAIGERLGIRPRIAIRVNPDFAVRGSGMRMGGGPQQFGVDAERVPALMDGLATCEIDLLGFHVFAGSQNLHADILIEAQRKTAELILDLAEAAPQPVRYVNLGGGFGIPYTAKDQPLDLASIGAALNEVLEQRLLPGLTEAMFVIELGRYLVGEAGVYVSRIVDIKESRGRRYLVIDGGMHHQLAASGNLGTPIRKNYPLVIADRMEPEATVEATVVGNLCTPLDLMGDRVRVAHAAVGDLVGIFQAGAYGLTASPTRFLGHPPPVEVLVGTTQRPPHP